MLGEGEDLVLRLEAAPLLTGRARWSLSFTGMDRNLRLSRTGSPRRAAAPVLDAPDPNEGVLHIDLEADERLPFDTDPADLRVSVSLRTRLRWVVRVAAGPGAATP